MVCNAILWLYVEWLYVILDGMIIVCDWRKKERYRIKDEGWDGDVIVCGMVVYNCMWLEIDWRWNDWRWGRKRGGRKSTAAVDFLPPSIILDTLVYDIPSGFINLPMVFWISG